MARKQVKWNPIASAEFCNGTSFRIEQAEQSKPAFRVVNSFDGKPMSYSKSESACWRAIRYAARISGRSERSTI